MNLFFHKHSSPQPDPVDVKDERRLEERVWLVNRVITDGCTYHCLAVQGVFSSKDKAETYVLEQMEKEHGADFEINDHAVDGKE